MNQKSILCTVGSILAIGACLLASCIIQGLKVEKANAAVIDDRPVDVWISLFFEKGFLTKQGPMATSRGSNAVQDDKRPKVNKTTITATDEHSSQKLASSKTAAAASEPAEAHVDEASSSNSTPSATPEIPASTAQHEQSLEPEAPARLDMVPEEPSAQPEEPPLLLALSP